MIYRAVIKSTLIEILWSNLTLEQNSSWIWLPGSTPMLVLSNLVYSELALECRQEVKSKNYFVHASNSTTKFLSVPTKSIIKKWDVVLSSLFACSFSRMLLKPRVFLPIRIDIHEIVWKLICWTKWWWSKKITLVVLSWNLGLCVLIVVRWKHRWNICCILYLMVRYGVMVLIITNFRVYVVCCFLLDIFIVLSCKTSI